MVKWRDTHGTVADRAEDIRGRRVLDPEGEEVGEIEDLFIATQERKVRWLQVASGGFLGLGATTFLLPVEAITRTGEEAVQIDQRRERMVGAPPDDPARVDQRDVHDLYGHYGDAPYWAAAGVYPPYPLDPPRPSLARQWGVGSKARHNRPCRVIRQCLEKRSHRRRLEVSKTSHIPLEQLILRALEIDRCALPNRVNYDSVG